MSTLLSVLHVVTAVFLVGPMAILPMVGMRAVRTGHGAQAVTIARSTNVFGWASLLVVVFGFGVLGTLEPRPGFDPSITTGWVLASLICYLVALLLTLVVVVPEMRSAGQSVAGDTDSDGRPSGYARIAASSGVASLLLLATVVLMAWKP